MKKILLFMMFAAVLCGAESNSVIASVNGKPIYKIQLEREISALLPMASYHGSVSESKKDDVKKEALDNLIKKELLYQQAIKDKIDVSDSELIEYEKAHVSSFGGRKNFDKALSLAKITLSEFRRELEREKTIQKLYEKRIKYRPSQEELKSYYNQNKQKFSEPEKIKIALIFREIDSKDPKSKAAAKAKIEEAYAKIKSGTSFGEVAYKYSTAMSRVKGGEMGYIHRGLLQSSEVEKIVFGMKKGEMSGIIDSEEGYFIVRLDDKKDAYKYSFDEIKSKLTTDLITSREEERQKVLLANLNKNAIIKK